MTKAKVSGNAMKQAIEKFGALSEANEQLQKENLDWQQKNSQLQEDNAQLKGENTTWITKRDELKQDTIGLLNNKREAELGLKSIATKLKDYTRQYELFCGFMAMVAESPSVTDSINILIASFQKLKEPGWSLTKNADEMRSFFIRTVMGDYLKSFRCDACGGKFITNMKPKSKLPGNGYWCPDCHNWYSVKEDDSFFKALVSKKQLEDTQHLEKVLENYKVIEAFKTFLNAPCEICEKPVKDWDDFNVKLVIKGVGCGHTRCWNSETGRLRELRKAIEKARETLK